MRYVYLGLVLALLLALGPLGGGAAPAHAANTVTVGTCDEGHLRGAITSAGAAGTVTFSCSGTITLAATITISQDLTIDGSGQAMTLSGGGSVHVLTINSGVRLTFNHITVANSVSPSDGGGVYNSGTLVVATSIFRGNIASGTGGGIYNSSGGMLIVSSSTFSGNAASGNGGGIFNSSGGTASVSTSTFGEGSAYAGGSISNYGTLSVTTSTFSRNSAAWGGAIDNNVGTLSVTNSTFSGNTASSYGGAINGGGVLSMSDSTLSGNSASYGGALNIGGGLRVSNTVVANSPSGGNCFAFAANPGVDGGGNLDDGTSCGFSAVHHSRSNASPQLLPLADNGGPTTTMALAAGSPAIDLGLPAICLTTGPSGANNLDQRGQSRHTDTRGDCDSGAFDTGNGIGVTQPILFGDGFESGNFAAWSSVQTSSGGTAVVEAYLVQSGQHAARLSATADAGSYAYVRKTLATSQTDLTVSGDFNVRAQGAPMSTVPLLRLFDGAGNLVVSLYRLNLTNGQLWVQHSGTYHRTTGMLPLKTWGHLTLHVISAGTDHSTVQVSLNGTLIYSVAGASLGTAGVQALQIGNEAHGQVFDLVADNIVAQ
jgi:predicted outer membrane repeat protein